MLKQYEVLTWHGARDRHASIESQLEAFLNAHIEPYQRIADVLVIGNLTRFILEARD